VFSVPMHEGPFRVPTSCIRPASEGSSVFCLVGDPPLRFGTACRSRYDAWVIKTHPPNNLGEKFAFALDVDIRRVAIRCGGLGEMWEELRRPR
jgi:hypothetical protein